MSYYKYSSVLEKFRLYRNTNKIRKEKKKFCRPRGCRKELLEKRLIPEAFKIIRS
jgi:hypothetical protein